MESPSKPAGPTPSTSNTREESSGSATVTTPIIKSSDRDSENKKAGGPKASVQIRDPPVSDTRGYTVVKVEDKQGPLLQAIPVMPLPLAVLFCLFNIVLPGTGTLMSAFTVFCCGKTKISKPLRAFGLNIATALLQMVTFVIIVGWIWSIRWGMTFVQYSLSSKDPKTGNDTTPYYVRRQSSVDYQKQHSSHSSNAWSRSHHPGNHTLVSADNPV